MCITSSDHGKSWRRRGFFGAPSAGVQLQIGQFSNATLLGMGQSGPSQASNLEFAISVDGTTSWSTAQEQADLPSQVGADMLVRRDVIYVSHDFNRSHDPGAAHDLDRNNMTVSTSKDFGRSWSHLPLLPVNPASGVRTFSGASCLADLSVAAEPSLGVLYERGADRFDGDGVWFVAIAYSKL